MQEQRIEEAAKNVAVSLQDMGEKITDAADRIDDNFVKSDAKETRVNKHIFAWVFNFLLGYLGIDRFIRGQIGLGILKLLTVGGFGFWSFIDWVIALVKAYGSAFGAEEDLLFINGKYAR